ncbi:MAG TPA: succinate--CoA ligase subunit alpha, partial [Anaeromyxobacteraceae bacterium]|nr:succinate--CoA ligase subunit alpha [Anaeromyxobacteraceae bacterium]
APPGKRMGHAGAVISGGSGTADAKLEAFREAGVTVCDGPHLLGKTMKELLEGRAARPRGAARPPKANSKGPEKPDRPGPRKPAKGDRP